MIIIIIIIIITEVEVGEMSAVETVLRSDTKRLKLLEEEKKLLAEGEKGDDSNSERLQAVYEELEAIGAASAEARARRILAVSEGRVIFSNEGAVIFSNKVIFSNRVIFSNEGYGYTCISLRV